MKDNFFEIKEEQLLPLVREMFHSGYRFVTSTCIDLDDGKADIIYHFDRNLEIRHYRLTINKTDTLPSISKIYFCAYMVENEMKELFGLNIVDIAIDYEGHMLLSDASPEAPMAKSRTIAGKRGSAG